MDLKKGLILCFIIVIMGFLAYVGFARFGQRLSNIHMKAQDRNNVISSPKH